MISKETIILSLAPTTIHHFPEIISFLADVPSSLIQFQKPIPMFASTKFWNQSLRCVNLGLEVLKLEKFPFMDDTDVTTNAAQKDFRPKPSVASYNFRWSNWAWMSTCQNQSYGPNCRVATVFLAIWLSRMHSSDIKRGAHIFTCLILIWGKT